MEKINGAKTYTFLQTSNKRFHNCISPQPKTLIQTYTIALTYFAKYAIEGGVIAVRKYLNIAST